MKLKTFLRLCTDPENIEQIVTLNIDGEPEKLIGYWKERTFEEFEQTMNKWGIPHGEEWDCYCKDFFRFLSHFDCEIIEFDVLDRTIKIESRLARAIEGRGNW